MQLNSDEIQQILPHRYPFLLVDRITECEPGRLVVLNVYLPMKCIL